MNLCPVLKLALWLVVRTVLPASAQLSLRYAPATHPCNSPAAGKVEGYAILATVKRMDPRRGQLEFTPEAGSFMLTAPPAAMHELRVGDQLLVCLHEDESEGKDRLAEDVPAALPRAP